MKFALTILGVNSATPAHGRFPSAQILQVQHQLFLIDCGEGSQSQMSRFGVPHHKIQHIFISHLHGDHVFGLPGLLFSLGLNDRKNDLHIYAPAGLEEMIMALLRPMETSLPYPLHFHVLDTGQSTLVFENDRLTVRSIPLRHRIPTAGFLFREKERPKNIRPEKIAEYSLNISQILAVKNGENITLANGRILPNEELTTPPPVPRSFAYVSDTAYEESIIPMIKDVDLLYHEATFCHDLADYAETTKHSTALQAATIAKKARARRLIIGHYSTRYKNIAPLIKEASAVFPETEPGVEGQEYEVPLSRVSE
ncbi:MAG: ribonuclease Z [Saprospiraceae bacterium]